MSNGETDAGFFYCTYVPLERSEEERLWMTCVSITLEKEQGTYRQEKTHGRKQCPDLEYDYQEAETVMEQPDVAFTFA